MSLKDWADLHGEDYPSRFRHSTSNKPPTIKDLQFCFDELLGELGWGDEIAETGVDPLAWARNEIKDLHKTIKRLRGSLELRDAANGKCKQCGTLHAEPIIHCDVCGAMVKPRLETRSNFLLEGGVQEIVGEVVNEN